MSRKEIRLEGNLGIEIIGSMRQIEFICTCPDRPHWTIRSRLDRKFTNLECDYCGNTYKIIYPEDVR